jgi:2,4-dichlorophenol 6-monooxygenase
MTRHRAEKYTKVLIVGAGPAGLTASLALSRLGVPHIVLDRYPTTAHTPRAHIVNQRTLEIMRDLGLEERILQEAIPNDLMANNVWFMSMAGDEVVRSQAWGGGEDHFAAYRRASPSLICNFAQHELEPMLVDAIEEAGVGEVRFGHEFIRFEQDDEGVTAWVTHRASGQSYTIRCDYLIGSDGARSRVMEQAGLTLDGETRPAQICFTWIRADLARYVEHRPGVLYWRVDFTAGAQEGGSFICVKPWNEWIVSWMIDPANPLDPNDHATLEARVRSAIGDRTTPFEIINASIWNVNQLYAPEYTRGRVMCMGDAVHRHPPTNGLGQNTSVADAFNLAWKIKYVLDGQADPALLATYSAERAPVGRQIVERANRTLMEMNEIPAALGITADQSPEERWERIQTLDDDTAEARARRVALDEAVALQDFGFNAIGVELGYRYRTGARVDDGTPEPVPPGHPDICYQATTWPGARLPHAWLDLGRRRVSTLDIVGRGRFVLLTGPGGGASWTAAAGEVQRLTGVNIAVKEIGTSHGGLRDSLRQWAKLREVEDSGAILVRPDAHVAWRANTSAQSSELPRVMAEVLGR